MKDNVEKPAPKLYKAIKKVFYDKFKQHRIEKWDIPIFRWDVNNGLEIYAVNRFKMDMLIAEFDLLSIQEGIPYKFIANLDKYKIRLKEKTEKKKLKMIEYENLIKQTNI